MNSRNAAPFYPMHQLTERRVFGAIVETARDSGVLPDKSVLSRPTGDKEWQRTVLNGYCVALDVSRTVILREMRQLGGPLASVCWKALSVYSLSI